MKPTAREIAFRNFYEILKTPPYAMIGYYKNLLRAFRGLFADNPEVIREMKRRIKEIEIMVGIVPKPKNQKLYNQYKKLKKREQELNEEIEFLEDYLPIENEWLNGILLKIYNSDLKKLRRLQLRLYRILMQIQPIMSLSTMETYMENNMNLKSFFREGGKKITQFEITEKLNRLIDWMNELAVDEMKYIRFSKSTLV